MSTPPPTIKLYLDDQTEDVRPTPVGWVRLRRAADCIRLMEALGYLVEEISLDHDLGVAPAGVEPYGDGYDVLRWIEERIGAGPGTAVYLPEIRIHTDNGPAIERMRAAVKQINALWERRCGQCGSLDTTTEDKIDSFTYITGESMIVSAVVPVLTCKACGLQSTDYRAEELRDAAVRQALAERAERAKGGASP